jgi:hypothetical protein
MSEKNNTGKANRKTYRKPQLEQVQLVVEETVLTACKVKASGPLTGCKGGPGTVCTKARGKS